MGTRTWTRKGVLTAAGKRRQAGAGGTVNAAILDIWGDVLGDDGLGDGSAPAVAPPTPPQPAITPQMPPPPPAKPAKPARAATAKPAKPAKVVPPPPPPWMGKPSAGAPDPIDLSKAYDSQSEVSKAFHSAGLILANDRTTQLSDNARQQLLRQPPLSMRDLLSRLNPVDSIAIVYEMRGWNAPATVDNWENIANRTDIERQPNGEPLLFWRSVSDSSGFRTAKISAAQKQANLRNGREHFVGRGIYGQSTYAAAAWGGSKNGKDDASMTQAVLDSAGYGENMTMFAMKKGSKLRLARVNKSGRGPMITATAKMLGSRGIVNDNGLAAALLGFDGYRCAPNSYWVIGNRSKMIIASTDIPTKGPDGLRTGNYDYNATPRQLFNINPITGQRYS